MRYRLFRDGLPGLVSTPQLAEPSNKYGGKPSAIIRDNRTIGGLAMSMPAWKGITEPSSWISTNERNMSNTLTTPAHERLVHVPCKGLVSFGLPQHKPQYEYHYWD